MSVQYSAFWPSVDLFPGASLGSTTYRMYTLYIFRLYLAALALLHPSSNFLPYSPLPFSILPHSTLTLYTLHTLLYTLYTPYHKQIYSSSSHALYSSHVTAASGIVQLRSDAR